jgi:four helix bundle protein
MNTAQGSLSEMEYHILLSNDLEYLKDNSLLKNMDEVEKLLHGYMMGIKKNTTNS